MPDPSPDSWPKPIRPRADAWRRKDCLNLGQVADGVGRQALKSSIHQAVHSLPLFLGGQLETMCAQLAGTRVGEPQVCAE